MNGWVKLHRQLVDWEWYTDSETKALFLHILLMANHKDDTWRGNEVKRGQWITGRKVISSQTGLSEQAVRTGLKRLKNSGEITIKSTNKFSMITICNYESYQCKDLNTNQLGNQQGNQPPNKPATSNQPAINHKQEGKEGKEGKNKPKTSTYSQQFENVWAAYPRKSGKKAAWKVWKREKLENIAGQILSSLELQKKSVAWAKDGGQFIPAGSTWFNGARWEDELDQLHVSAPAPTNGKKFDKNKYLNGGMNPMLEDEKGANCGEK